MKFRFLFFLLYGASILLFGSNIIRPDAWGVFPKDTTVSFTGGIYSLRIAPGQEGEPCISFYSGNRWKNLPAGTPLRVAFWSRTLQGAILPGKSSKLGFFAHIGRISGKNFFPAIQITRSDSWQYHEQIFTAPEELVKFHSAYLTANNFSGEIQYSDLYFGVWDAMAQIEEARPEIAVSGSPVEISDFYANSSNFQLLNPHQIPKNKTRVRLHCDSTALHAEFICESEFLDPVRQRLADFKAKATTDGLEIFSDDCVELFLECADKSILQLACNANGARFTGKNSNPTETSWNVKTYREDGFWRAQMTIPWASLGYNGIPKSKLLFNVTRSDKAANQDSAFCELQNDNHEVERFGRLSFGQQGASIAISPAIPPNALPGKFNLKVTPDADCHLSLQCLDQKNQGAMSEIQAKAGEPSDLSVSLAPGGIYRMRLIACASDGTLLYRTPWRKISCSAALTARVQSGTVAMDGKSIPANGTLYLQKGVNEITALEGEAVVCLTTPFGDKQEKIAVQQKHILAAGEVKPMSHLNVEQGLFIEKGGTQHLPLVAERNANGKFLELRIPAGMELIGQKDIARENIKIGSAPYILTRWPVANQKIESWVKRGYYVFPIVLKLLENSPDTLPPVYYRLAGEGYTECWNQLNLNILPAIKAPKVNDIPLRIECAFGVGLIDADGAKAILSTLANCGFNWYMERRACMGDYEWHDAGRAAGLKICSELNIKCIGVWSAMDVIGSHGGHCPAPLHVMMGAKKEKLTKYLSDYIKRCQPEMLDFDLEFPTKSEFDASLESRQRFASWAHLETIPEKNELLEDRLRAQWDSFCAMEMAQFCKMLREIIKKQKQDCLFEVYSSYPGKANKQLYGIDWTLFPGIADWIAVGYGRPSEQTTIQLRQETRNLPVVCGVLTDTMRHAAMVNLSNESLWRLTMGYDALLYFEWSSFDGLARTQIARLAEILSEHGSRILHSRRISEFAVTGQLLKHECQLLEKDGEKLMLAFNFGGTARKGTVQINGQTIQITVPPHDCATVLVK